jgi:hypothetical protein
MLNLLAYIQGWTGALLLQTNKRSGFYFVCSQVALSGAEVGL